MSEQIINKNISSLNRYNSFTIPYLANLFSSQTDFNSIEEIETAQGQKSIFLKKEEKKYLIHSKYNPVQEAKNLVSTLELNRDSLIVVFGLGMAYHLFELKDRISPNTIVIVVEHNIDIVKYCFSNIDLSSIFDTGQFLLVFGEEREQETLITQQIGYYFKGLMANVQVLVLPNYQHVYQKENQRAIEKISQVIKTLIISKGNSIEDTLNGWENLYRNIDTVIEASSVEEVRGKFKGVPAIVVAAGPSLDKNIHLLKEAEGKAVIMAVDASIRACEKVGVKPDIITAIEREELIYTCYFEGKDVASDIPLAGPGLLWPQIFEEYRGKKIVMSKDEEGIEGWWYSQFADIKYVNQGFSCAHVAYALAKQMGCNPIVLIGQDLAFTNEKEHSELTHTEHHGENNARKADLYLEDYEGNPIPSSWVYRLFKDWYEHEITMNPHIKVIDATEGGAYIKGTEIMSFREVIDTYCTKPIPYRVNDLLVEKSISSLERQEKYKKAISGIEEQIARLEEIKEKAGKHFETLNQLGREYDFASATEKQLFKVLDELKNGDKIIQLIYESSGLINMLFGQIITQTVIHVKRIKNELTGPNVQRNIELQQNLMYMLMYTSDVVIGRLKKGKEFIEKEKIKIRE